MKSFIIYIKGNTKSEEYAKTCLDSCAENFDAELFEGVTPQTLDTFEKQYNFSRIIPSRVDSFFNQDKNLFKTKKSCFMNHVRLWNICLELKQPIAVIEQDSFCVKKWNNLSFDEVLILNAKSAFDQPVFNHVWKVKKKPTFKEGVNLYQNSPLKYDKDNFLYNSDMMPGTAAYAITPVAAEKLLNSLFKHGWEQSDYFINSINVKIQYAFPEYFTFKLKNLNMSHGKNI